MFIYIIVKDIKTVRNMNKKIVVIIVGALGFAVLCPLVIDWFIFGNNFPSNIGNESWAGFLGSYLGAIIGGLVSLFGIVITIWFTQDQNRRDRELQIRPYFDFMFNRTAEIASHRKEVGYLAFECDPEIDNNEGKKPVLNGLLIMKNIGVGTAINCSAKCECVDLQRPTKPILFQIDKRIAGVQAFEAGEEGGMVFHICMNLAKIPKEEFIDFPLGKTVPHEYVSNSPRFSIRMEFEYSDLLENRYQQILTFKADTYVSYKHDASEDAEYLGELHLIDVTRPVKITNN